MRLESGVESRVSLQENSGKKLALDERTFQQLLESAYVLQKHNDEAAASATRPTTSDPLAEILETQKTIQTQKLDLPDAA